MAKLLNNKSLTLVLDDCLANRIKSIENKTAIPIGTMCSREPMVTLCREEKIINCTKQYNIKDALLSFE